jgi:hypothetical protein
MYIRVDYDLLTSTRLKKYGMQKAEEGENLSRA